VEKANINPLPVIQPYFDVSLLYDLKHSREMERCSSDGTDDEGAIGYLGDFLREWEKPVRRAINEMNTQNTTDGEATSSFAATPYSKTTCLLKAFAHDLAILDSAYPSAKLVDQSALITVVNMRGPNGKPREETDVEKAIIDSHNNILRIRRDDGTKWLMVVGLIDLFANKKAPQSWKRFQSHRQALTKEYVFDMKKFSMYPFQLGCLLQYLFYYRAYDVDDKGELQSAVVNDGAVQVSYSWWPGCEARGDPFRSDEYDASDTQHVHTAGQLEHTCSLMNTCHALLANARSEAPANLQECCRRGHYTAELLGVGASC
jgi:hypothetical protein